MQVARQLGFGMSHAQCRRRWEKMSKQRIRDLSGTIMEGHSSDMDPHWVKPMTAMEIDAALLGIHPVIATVEDRETDVEIAFKTQQTIRRLSEEAKTKWTPAMDAVLKHAMETYGNKWVKVAADVGRDVTQKNCQDRWNNEVNPAVVGYKDGDWSKEEFYLLKALVQYFMKQYSHDSPVSKRSINWTAISKRMKRKYKSCQETWNHIRCQSLNQGHFKKQEDDIILQRVRELENKTNATGRLPLGVWTSIGNELNRNAKSVSQRYTLICASGSGTDSG